MRKAFRAVKVELDDHLETINQNTGEIQACQGEITELEAKINKISERLEELEMFVHPGRMDIINIKLTPREQEVFMTLYLNKELSLLEITRRLGFTEDMVNMYIFNIMSKGVPIRRELFDNVLVFGLDPEFKELQARRNVLDIDPRIAKQVALHKV